jgi:hypothetical protein
MAMIIAMDFRRQKTVRLDSEQQSVALAMFSHIFLEAVHMR